MNEKDFERVYRTYFDPVYRYALALTRDVHDAEELTQETFFQAVRSVRHYDGSCRISTWLCGIAQNVLYTHFKKQKHSAMSLEEVPEPAADSAEEAVLGKLGQEIVLSAVHRLPEPGREILHLRLLGGLSFRQIGDILNQTETWARVNYYRAKQSLIKELNRHE